jgi:hypothetical protein
MTSDPLSRLRAAAPQIPPASDAAREAAYLAALALPISFEPVVRKLSLRRWWIGGVAAVTSLLVVVTGTAIPASGTIHRPSRTGPAAAVVSAPATPQLYLTRPDGTVYVVTNPHR